MMEAGIVFGRLMHRWPALALLQPEPRWNRNPVYRELATLEVHVPVSAAHRHIG
jgi:hypothetical protein